MGALQKLQVIHVATHDSIGAGEDGPTHQPIELAALYRAMPTLLYIRPGDSEEVAGAWKIAIEAHETPSIISVSRHALPQTGVTRRDMVAKGGYVIKEVEGADVTLIATGAELSFALEVAKHLESTTQLKVRCVSMPCQRLFDQQPREYRRSVLKRTGKDAIPAVVIEPYAGNGWAQYADAGINMKTFGHSLPGKYIYKHFGFTTEGMAERVERYVRSVRDGEAEKGEWVDL